MFLFSVISPNQVSQFGSAAEFVAKNQLSLDSDIEYLVVGWQNDRMVACGGLAGHVLKCIVIDASFRGCGLSARVITQLLHLADELNRHALFLFTKPENEAQFQGNGFYTIAKTAKAILMENSPTRLNDYCVQLRETAGVGDKIGTIVMNANPFTIGHRYLIEQAVQQCDWLHVILVKEEASQFSHQQRFQLVKAGIASIPRVTCHEGSPYTISRATFPNYFIKDQAMIESAYVDIDLALFRNAIAPALGITHRFVGTEPNDVVTRHYHQQMKQQLMTSHDGRGHIEVIEIPRLTVNHQVVSASRVRQALAVQDWETINALVPETTWQFLRAYYQT